MPYTYDTYFYTEVISGLLFSGLAVAGFSIYAFLPCCCSEDKDGNLRKSTRVLYPFIKKHEESNETIIFGYVLEKWYIIWLFIVAQIIVAITMFILGFNLFVINSSVCSTGYDCFANKTLIVNCSSDEKDVECFQLTCNIGNAVGAATGAQIFAMATANIIMRTILYFASKVVSIKNVYGTHNTPLKKVVDKHKDKARKKCGIIGIISCQIVTGVIFVSLVTAAVWVQAVVPLENFSLSFGCILELFLLCIALIFSCLVFWCFGFKRTSKKEVRQNLRTACDSLETIEVDLQKAKDSLQKAKDSLQKVKDSLETKEVTRAATLVRPIEQETEEVRRAATLVRLIEQETEAYRRAARMSVTTALVRLSKIQRDSEQVRLKLPSAQLINSFRYMERSHQHHRKFKNIQILYQTENWIQNTKENLNKALDDILNINRQVHVPTAIKKIEGALSAITEQLQFISTIYNIERFC